LPGGKKGKNGKKQKSVSAAEPASHKKFFRFPDLALLPGGKKGKKDKPRNAKTTPYAEALAGVEPSE
jgi:hypothetical protein